MLGVTTRIEGIPKVMRFFKKSFYFSKTLTDTGYTWYNVDMKDGTHSKEREMVTVKYLVAMRDEYYEQHLAIVETEVDNVKKAYNKINNIIRSRTSKSTFERSRQMTPEIEEMYNALQEYTRYTCINWETATHSDGRTYEEIHRDLYKFLRCERDIDSLKSMRIKRIASVYGHLFKYTTHGYPIAYYMRDMDELVALCGDCANKLDAEEKGKLIDYDVLEGDTRDHGELTCEKCQKLIVNTEFTIKVMKDSGEEVVYTGNDTAEAYAEYDKVKAVDTSVALFQDEVQIEPEHEIMAEVL
jgi:hypothetical protein